MGYNTAMFGLSLSHLLILLFIVLLFGARRLPELGSAMGRGLRAFKKGLEGLDDDSKIQAPKQIAKNDKDDSSKQS
jgi:sec-independent protein translocase protein TatA